MSNINNCLDELLKLDGALAVALVDFTSGACLGNAGYNKLNLKVSAANKEVIKSKIKVREKLGADDYLDDFLLSLQSQYHLIRILKNHRNLFVYYVLDKTYANLAMAHHKLTETEQAIEV